MQYVVVGILGSYADAEAAVRDLELAGIVGEQVEVISDIDQDARTANTSGEPSTKPDEPHHSWIARLFGAGGLSKSPKCATFPANSQITSANRNFTPII
jgi:hypothetical protein